MWVGQSILLAVAIATTLAVADAFPGDEERHGPGENKIYSRSYFSDRESLILKRKVFLYRDELYTPWSVWTNCSLKDCTEFRFRKCLNDTYTERVVNLFKTKNCPFQYVAETRRCTDDSECYKPGELSPLIKEQAEGCGVQPTRIVTKIVGGTESEPHNWPWQIGLYVTRTIGGGRSRGSYRPAAPFCGATLITLGWAVTAAHCITELVPQSELPTGYAFSMDDEADLTITARLGDHNRAATDTHHEMEIRVENVILHPEYRRGWSEHGYDIALLELEAKARVEKGGPINTACVPDSKLKLKPGLTCFAAGWGELSSGRSERTDGGGFGGGQFFPDLFRDPLNPFSSMFLSPYRGFGRREKSRRTPRQPLTLHEVDLPLLPLSKCKGIYYNLRDGVHICAGEKKKDTCRGDSGGGLFCEYNGRYQLYGVTSFGSGKGCGRSLGVYTYVPGVADWINEHVR